RGGTMLYKSLILGVLFSIGVFAVKSGVGVAYGVWHQKRKRDTALGLVLFALGYALIFGAAAVILPRLDLARHLSVVQTWVQHGMLVHLIMAALMMGWGVVLLRHSASPTSSRSRGWLMLVLPCPLCLTVILLSYAFLIACFPDHPIGLAALLFFAFVLISLVTTVAVRRYGQISGMPPDLFLGGVMLLMSLYFIVSVTVMPHFADLDKVYRMARYDAGQPSREIFQAVVLAVCIAGAFASGFFSTIRKTRSPS
ncbi:DUF2162 domain-containing protein, partial [Desulfosarcina cetonica]